MAVNANTEMIETLRESVKWIELLIRDLEIGTAKVVPPYPSHVYAHFWKEEPAPSHSNESTGELIPMMMRHQCVDILKLWGFYLYISEKCPKTGTRFVEGLHREF